MGSVLQCLFRVCCDKEEQPDLQQQQVFLASPTPPHNHETRMGTSTPTMFRPDATMHDGGGGMRAFLRLLRWCRHRPGAFVTAPIQATNSTTTTQRPEHIANDDDTADFDYFGKPRSASISSPLRTAQTFDCHTFTIEPEQIVLPGSALQQEMALTLTSSQKWALAGAQEDECVICMESFTPHNPKMPTLCGCGRNKTSFHLPCLYQWMEQSHGCPSCRQKMTWEEF